MRRSLVLAVLAGCAADLPASDPPIDPPPPAMPAPIALGDFDHPLDRAYIRGFQTWLDDSAFDVKWSAMLTSPIVFLGSADSAFHADLASLPHGLPGAEALCHGDAKLDNFGWTRVSTASVFSDNDFDDAGFCPAAADVLHFLLATDLVYGDPALDAIALDAYVDTLARRPTIGIDPTTEPSWDALRHDGVDKATHGDTFALDSEVQAASADEVAAVRGLVSADSRFPRTLVDVARDVKTSGGSAGLRRFWLLVEDAQHPRTIIELKELTVPGTEFGPHSTTLDGDGRLDALKTYWWETSPSDDHFVVHLFGSVFVARDRFRRRNFDPAELTISQRANVLAVEGALLAAKHRDAWTGTPVELVGPWLEQSSATLIARWRDAYATAGGM